MLWPGPLLFLLFQVPYATIATISCSSSSETTAGSWPRIPFDCFDQASNELQFTHIGSGLVAAEAQQSERLLGRFRYFIEKADPHFSKLPVIMSSDRMELEWKPDQYARGLGFSSYTSRGSHIFWSLERKFGFREARARWTTKYGRPGTFTLSRREPILVWPPMPFRAVYEPPLRIVDFEKVGFIPIGRGDQSDVESLLEEKFPRALFSRGDFARSSVASPSRKFFYTVTFTENFDQDSLGRSTIWYAHQVFTFCQGQFGFRPAKAVLKDSGGKIIGVLELDTPHLLGIGVSGLTNSTDTG